MSRSSLTFGVGTVRNYNGTINPPPPSLTVLDTVNDFDDEAWSHIRQYVLIRNSWSITQNQRRNVEALLDRSQMFYEKFKLIKNDPSSGLMSYYFALNLAKAYLWLNADYTNKKMVHGVSFTPTSKDRIGITISGRPGNVDVFPELYRLVKGTALTVNDSLSVKDLQTRIRELALQNFFAGVKHSSIGVKFSIGTIVSPEEAYAIIRIANAEVDRLHDNKTMLRVFNQYFERIDLNPTQRKDMFNETAFDSAQHVYFQSLRPKTSDVPLLFYELEDEIKAAFSNRAKVNIFDHKIDYDVHLPIRGKRNYQMDELLAGYCLLFWVSSVIRYDPSLRMIGPRSSQTRFMFDEVSRNCPYITLRHFTSLITRKDIAFARRS